MLIVGQLIVVFIICITLSYFLGKYFLTRLFPESSALLYMPFGFIVYEVLFFFLAVGFVYLHGSWHILVILASIVIGLICLWTLVKANIKEEIMRIKQIPKVRLIAIVIVVLIGLAHGIIQIGFWNADHAMSDNSFYISVATSVLNNDQMFAINAADGMIQATVINDYFLSPFEISLSFLAQIFQLHPATFIRIITPVWMSLAIFLTVFCVFRQLLKKDKYALIAIFLYVFIFYYSPNYKNKINDYMLEEWFMSYLYLGKVIVRYLVIPFLFSLMIQTKQAFNHATQTTRRLILQACGYNIIGLAALVCSPAACLYYLAIMLLYFMFLLINKKYPIKQVLIVGLGSALSGVAGAIGILVTKIMSDGGVANASESDPSWLRFLGINSEHFNLDTLKNFFISGVIGEENWYPRFPHIAIFVFAIIAIIIFINIKRKQKKISPKKTPTEQFFAEYDTLIFLGIALPVCYAIFYHLPPIIEIVVSVIATFGFQRLVGSYPYEIMMIALLIISVVYINDVLLTRAKHMRRKTKKQLKLVATSMITTLCLTCFILAPTRVSVYQHAMSQERRDRLKFQDDYYMGVFNYQLLLTNPYKLDYQAEQLVSVLSAIPGSKIVAGSINQFFGLSHLRTYDNTISIVRTRFSRYADSQTANYAYQLKIYFSPWEERYDEYQEKYSIEHIKMALKTFDTNYLVLIKEHKTNQTFGEDMLVMYDDIIVNVYETEQFYLAELDLKDV